MPTATTVFRDGGFVQTGALADIDRRQLVKLIVGREVRAAASERRAAAPGEPLLSVQGLTRRGEFEDISLDVAPGEVLGIYGLMGSGRSEFLNCLYGLTRADQGQASLGGRPLPRGNPAASIKAGLALVTEDRKATGLVMSSSVRFNTSLPALPGPAARRGGGWRGRARAGGRPAAAPAREAGQPGHAGLGPERRQPAEGGAGPLHGHQSRLPAVRRAHARHRRRRQARGVRLPGLAGRTGPMPWWWCPPRRRNCWS